MALWAVFFFFFPFSPFTYLPNLFCETFARGLECSKSLITDLIRKRGQKGAEGGGRYGTLRIPATGLMSHKQDAGDSSQPCGGRVGALGLLTLFMEQQDRQAVFQLQTPHSHSAMGLAGTRLPTSLYGCAGE